MKLAILRKMSEVRITAIAEPIAESPETAQSLITSVFRAELMNLLPGPGTGEIVLNEDFVFRFVDRLHDAGIARGLTVSGFVPDHKVSWADVARILSQSLEDSPHPQWEWTGVRGRLEDDLLARVLSISPTSLRRYASGERETPDEVAWRLHVLTRVIASLSGSYNDHGIRRWFERSRSQLDRRTPADVLAEASGEDDEQLREVVELADSLVGPALAA
jgi:hypothetical protein